MDYPLLIKGYKGKSAAAGGVVIDNYDFEKHRGDVAFLDIMSDLITNGQLGKLNLSSGGVNLIEDSLLNAFRVDSYPKSYSLVTAGFSGGQTVQVRVDNTLGTSIVTSFLHVYHTNPFMKKGWKTPIFAPSMSLKTRDLITTLSASAKGAGQDFVVSKGQGDVHAIQIIASGANLQALTQSFLTVSVDGVNVIEDASLGLGIYNCSRPMLLFPIYIQEASTIRISGTNLDSANSISFGLRLFHSPLPPTA